MPRPTAAWSRLNRRITACDRCPRLIDYCAEIGRTKRAAYRDQAYWAGPVPNFGDPDARLLIVGLAPGAHGANRTGRMFTGDRSGDFLYDALHRTAMANQPTCTDRSDGLELHGIAITAAAHCAPPANKPTTDELANCSGFLSDTAAALPNLRGMIALGSIAWDACLKLGRANDWWTARPKPRFGHGTVYEPDTGAVFLVGSYHPSQQNTFTGRLTKKMLVTVLRSAAKRAGVTAP